MACLAPSHYLYQRCYIAKSTNMSEIFIEIKKKTIQENAFQSFKTSPERLWPFFLGVLMYLLAYSVWLWLAF